MDIIINRSASHESASIMLVKASRSIATASASVTPITEGDDRKDPTMVWFVNRVWVYPEGRSSGLGTTALQELKLLIQSECTKTWWLPTRMVVTPGGYGSDPQDLHRFYIKNHFNQIREGFYEFMITLDEKVLNERATRQTQTG